MTSICQLGRVEPWILIGILLDLFAGRWTRAAYSKGIHRRIQASRQMEEGSKRLGDIGSCMQSEYGTKMVGRRA